MTSHIERLRRLSMSDRRSVDEVLGDVDDADATRIGSIALDARTVALVRIAALVALDGPASSFDAAVAVALAAGATPDDIVDTMIAVAPTVASACLVSAAPKLAVALGDDVDGDLDGTDPASSGS
ncbi:MAG TPA: carboxymuconolactone decarboxylase family protein [Candidatus Limnocylindrales bacterium]|nr:carboxymuconolactone decarboxylase family protein [Candidatus Limnocylindrales bacterium]